MHTLARYGRHTQSFGEGTRDHDVSQNIAALLKHIVGAAPFDMLDFGFDPGRDLRTFKALGHRAVGLAGAPSGCEVLEQSLLQFELLLQHFDGVFSNAVLFHVPSQGLRQLHACLRPGGVPFSYNPRGAGLER